MPATVGFVRDSDPFCEARFSCRQAVRIVGIALDLGDGRSNGLKVGVSFERFVKHRPTRIDARL
jgi:hypothetical protein